MIPFCFRHLCIGAVVVLLLWKYSQLLGSCDDVYINVKYSDYTIVQFCITGGHGTAQKVGRVYSRREIRTIKEIETQEVILRQKGLVSE